MNIVVTEYPKSGGTWFVSVLGDALAVPKRDIYVTDQHSWYTSPPTGIDIRMHPWFVDSSSPNLTEECVIKSHEMPNSTMIEFPAQYIHLVRDGRDVVVSKYFFEKDFCVANGIYSDFNVPFEEYVSQTASEWREYVLAWKNAGVDTVKYEDLLLDAGNTTRTALECLGMAVNNSDIQRAVEANTKVKVSQAMGNANRHNTFVRKGISGDWKNYFTPEDERLFNEQAGDALVEFGYLDSLDC